MSYVDFVGPPSELPDARPSRLDVLRFISLRTSPTNGGPRLLNGVADELTRKYSLHQHKAHIIRSLQGLKKEATKWYKSRNARERGLKQYHLAKTPMFSVSTRDELAECTPITKRARVSDAVADPAPLDTPLDTPMDTPLDTPDSPVTSEPDAPNLPGTPVTPEPEMLSNTSVLCHDLINSLKNSLPRATHSIVEELVKKHLEHPEDQLEQDEDTEPIKRLTRNTLHYCVSELLLLSDESDDSDDSDDSDYTPGPTDHLTAQRSVYVTRKIGRTACELGRAGLGDEASARVLTCLVRDFNLDIVITCKKVREARESIRLLCYQMLAGVEVEAVYFDGKEDKDTPVNVGGHVVKKKVSHYTLVKLPEERYLGFCIPKSGAALDIAEGIVDYMAKAGINFQKLNMIGCDGTNVNIGHKGGAVAHLERMLERPLMRAICILHHAELPFRHLFMLLDGTTTSPSGFSGPIGTLVGGNVWERPIANFKKIDIPVSPLPEEVVDKLSTDNKYLYRICLVATTGEVPANFGRLKIGPVCHSRWLTLAARIVRYYLSVPEKEHQEAVRLLVTYIIGVYFKVHSDAKYKSDLVYGPVHLHEEIQLIKRFGGDHKEFLYRYVQINGFYAHPENILVGMLGHSQQFVRVGAVELIRRIRSASAGSETGGGVRPFILAAIDFTADNFWEMTKFNVDEETGTVIYKTVKGNWDPVTEPPITMGLSDEALERFINTPLRTGYPCHTQSVERLVALTSQATSRITGDIRQIGEAMAIIKARNYIPGRVVRKDFNL